MAAVGKRRYAWLAIEVSLALVIVFMIGRLTESTGSSAAPGPVDVGFSQDMAVHHEQAVLMASLAQTRGGVAVKAMANAILVTQSEEVGLLRGWLTLWHEPAAAPAPMSWMPARAGGMHMRLALGATEQMPGMASSQELALLSTKTGTAFDVLFLQLMIRHHQGGIEMAQSAQAHAKLAAVRAAARAMAFAQIEELAQLQPLLTANGGTPFPSP